MPTPQRKNRTQSMGSVYPSTNQVTDYHAKQSLILLWDRLQALEAALQATQLTVQDHGMLIVQAQETADAAAQSAAIVAGAAAGVNPLGGGATGDIPWEDGGGGWAAMASSGPTGHIATGSPPTPYNVGLVVGGTAKEWAALLAPAGSGPARDANLAELLNRMIWHLNNAGWTAGNNRNPSGATGIDNLTFYDEMNIVRGYDVFPGSNFSAYGDFTAQATVHMLPLLVTETGYIANGGTPD